MHKLIAVPVTVILVAAAGSHAHAGSIDTVVITATRTAQMEALTGDSLSIITASDLKAQQTLIVTDALEQTPGVAVARNGGPGQITTVGLRGAPSGQTLVLIDGVRINDPSTVDDEAVLGDLLVNNIARIEVLRGPQSTLYGSDAIGGVIDVLTRQGGKTPVSLIASTEGGSFDTYRLNAAANGTLDDLDYGAAINYFHSNGISAADVRNGNRETDGTSNLGATANTRYHISDSLSLDLRGYYTNARTGFDDNYLPPTYQVADSPVYQRNTLFAGYAGVNFALFDGRWRNRFAFLGTHSKRTTFDSPYYLPLHEDYFYHGEAQRIEYQGIVDVSPSDQLTFGAETERSALNSAVAGFPDAKGHNRISGYYLHGQSTLFEQLTLSGGVRYDDDAAFGGHTSVKIAGAWTPNAGDTVLRANYGDGFKSPTLYELFSVYSNPLEMLRPETANGWEAGADQSILSGRIRASVTYFERRAQNQIDFFSCYGVTSAACTLRSAVGGYYYNVGRSRTQGLETSVTAQLTDTLKLSANYTNMHAIDLGTGTDLARRPHVTANARIEWAPLADWSFGAAAIFVGRRYDGAGGVSPLGSHTTANLYVSHALNEHLEAFGRIENLFDAHYEPVAGYGAPGRAVYAGIRASY